MAIFKLQVVGTLNGAQGMQNKIFLRSNSALSDSGSYVGHVTTNFIFAVVPAVTGAFFARACATADLTKGTRPADSDRGA